MGLGYRWYSWRRRLRTQLGESIFLRQLVVAATLYFTVWGLLQLGLPVTDKVVRSIHWSVTEYQPEVNWERLRQYSQEHWRLPVLPALKGNEEDIEAVPTSSLTGYVFPVEGRVISRYGWRIHPIYGDKRFHQGIDIEAPSGTPVKCIYGGYIARVGEEELLGRVVEVNHGNGLVSLYGHLGEVWVEEKQVVRTGEVIATVGTSGLTTGPHLHLEMKERGVNVDPAVKLGVMEEPVVPTLTPSQDEVSPYPTDEAMPGPQVEQRPNRSKEGTA
ncbi:MAG: M23 family metallopeptidase [Firmicutes bacterium]|nr:M23 family metallopeptidase [Bacillota bacterium]